MKEYNYEGELLFEGEYKEGKRSGFGKKYPGEKDVYYINGNVYSIIFEKNTQRSYGDSFDDYIDSD